MTILRRHSRSKNSPAAVAAVGNFDGYHLGHQRILGRVSEISRSRGLTPILISLYPHPREVLSNIKLAALCSLEERLELLKNWGIDELILLRFTQELSRISGKVFLSDLVFKQLSVQHLVIGADAAFGKNRATDLDQIKTICSQLSVGLDVLGFEADMGQKIGSRLVRESLEQGKLENVSKFLGRDYSLRGRVVHGERVGHDLGFPTINLHCPNQLIPAKGVYVTRTNVGARNYPSVTNIGVRPTVSSGSSLRVETHFLKDPPHELYGERVSVGFISKIREEVKFASIAELKRQIACDVDESRRYWKERGER